MSPEHFQRLLKRTPFAPFRVHLTDGRVFPVLLPDLLMLGKRSAVIGIVDAPAPDQPAYDRFEINSLLHVVSLEPLPTQPKPRPNAG
jgi:hypothetical protein